MKAQVTKLTTTVYFPFPFMMDIDRELCMCTSIFLEEISIIDTYDCRCRFKQYYVWSGRDTIIITYCLLTYYYYYEIYTKEACETMGSRRSFVIALNELILIEESIFIFIFKDRRNFFFLEMEMMRKKL